jgi:hypothetical protein
VKKAAKFSERETKNHARAQGEAKDKAGLSGTMFNGSGERPQGSAKMAGDTRGIMRNGGNTPRNVPMPTGKVRSTMHQ